MELQFLRSSRDYLTDVLREVRSQEQSQEMKLPEGMPDIGRIIASWGQAVVRSKEWRGDSAVVNGGILVWVLYAPEDGGESRVVDGWIPFQMRWELPEGTREGKLMLDCRVRSVDARSTSPRKIMVRAATGALARAVSPVESSLYAPGNLPEDVHLRPRSETVRLAREAGEKAFVMDEELSIPEGNGEETQAVYCTLCPEITDKKVMGDKIAFRGNGNAHILWRSGSTFTARDYLLPFSQFVELEDTYGSDGETEIRLCVTDLDLDTREARLKVGIAAQYLLTGEQEAAWIADAYSNRRELNAHSEPLSLPVYQAPRMESVSGEQALPSGALDAVDLSFQPDYPRVQQGENGLDTVVPGNVQVLYRGEDGALGAASARWEGRTPLLGAQENMIGIPMKPEEMQILPGSEGARFRAQVPVALEQDSSEPIQQITGLSLGQLEEPDAGRPSLILRRAGEEDLWDLAKRSGSTEDAIRKANGLTGLPAREQMLLIPIE